MKIRKDFEIAMKVLSFLKTQKGTVKAADIAQAVGTTMNFVEQVLAVLKKNHVLLVSRGPGGGYVLNSNCMDTSAFDVATMFGTFKEFDCDHEEAETPVGRLLKAVQDAYVNTII